VRTHRIGRALLGEGVVIIENLAHLDGVPPRFMLFAAPLMVKGGSGAPCRAIDMAESRPAGRQSSARATTA
jgi:kynurenine formamidase